MRVWPLGPSYAVALDGTVALFGRGRELTLADVSDPLVTPPIVGKVTLPGQVVAIALSPTVAGLAAVSMGIEEVALVDDSSPSRPVMTRHVAVGGRAAGLAFGPTDGGFLQPPIERLFVTRRNRGVQIVEYDHPSGPMLRGSSVHGTPYRSNSTEVVVDRFNLGGGAYADRAFVADQTTGLSVLDVPTPMLRCFPPVRSSSPARSPSSATRSATST